LADFEVRPISELHEREPGRPLFLLDASRISQANVGGPKDVIPDVVIDTHMGDLPPVNRVALLSHEHVATGSIVLEYLRHIHGDDWFDDGAPRRQSATGLRWGIYTDSGEDNYATPKDRKALDYLEARSDSALWGNLLDTPFFLRVDRLFEKGKRLYVVRQGCFAVNFEHDDLANCRDYLGAVADRLLQHLNGVAVLTTGVISLGEKEVLCAALRLNRFHRGFSLFNAEQVLALLKEHGGGIGSQVNGQVWGGSCPSTRIHALQRQIVTQFMEQAQAIHRDLGGLSFDAFEP